LPKARHDAPPSASQPPRTFDSGAEGDGSPTEAFLRGSQGLEELTAPAALAEGSIVDHFRVKGPLGRGGMGIVYRAEDQHLHREVALKVLPAFHVNDAGRRRRMLREARAAAAVNHPNIATVYGIGEAEGRIYIAMELIRGQSLARRLEAGPLTVKEAIHIAREVLSGLSKAHQAGLIHRDLKPDNIMLTEEGVAKVLDFGLARPHVPPTADAAASPDPTASGVVFGTPRYMSPEQARDLALDPRSDLFSFGVLFYEMLAGRRPFEGNTVLDVLHAIVYQTPMAPSELRAEISPALSQIVLRCLAKKPEARYPDGASLLRALELCSPSGQGSPVSSPRSGGAPPASGASSRSRRGQRAWVSQKAGLAAGLLVLVGIGASVLVWRSRSSEPAAQPAKATAITDLSPPASPSPEAIAVYQAALRSIRQGDSGQAGMHLQRAIALDPLLAVAHLRLALYFEQVGSTAESRASYAQAAQGRASLSERDQALLHALEPTFNANPLDVPLTALRLRETTRSFPGDAELFFLSAYFETHDHDTSLRAAQRAAELDDKYADAWQLVGTRLSDADRMEEALEALGQCVANSPASVDCRGERARLHRVLGHCAAMEEEARSALSTSPKAVPFLYEAWVDALHALGRPRDEVLRALAQKWAQTPEDKRRPIELYDRARLDFEAGQFAQAKERLLEGSRLSQSDRNALIHAKYAALLVQIERETGRPKDAVKVADAYRKREEVWQSSQLALGPTLSILRTLLHAGALSKDAFVKERDALLTEGLGTNNTDPGSVWFFAYVYRIEQREEAEEAMAALAKLPPGSPSRTTLRLFSADLGRMYLLAGRMDEARTSLRPEHRACSTLGDGPGVSLTLGQVLEETGDKDGACAAYQIVLDQWGDARPRSVTAEKARAREKALGCATPKQGAR
jgi:eukaryotic-like serine/threonine-protein kinase